MAFQAGAGAFHEVLGGARATEGECEEGLMGRGKGGNDAEVRVTGVPERWLLLL